MLTGIGSPGHRFVAPLPSKGYNIGLASPTLERPFACLSDVTQQLSVVDSARDGAGVKMLAASRTRSTADLREGDTPASHADRAAPGSPRGWVSGRSRGKLELVRRLPSWWLE